MNEQPKATERLTQYQRDNDTTIQATHEAIQSWLKYRDENRLQFPRDCYLAGYMAGAGKQTSKPAWQTESHPVILHFKDEESQKGFIDAMRQQHPNLKVTEPGT